MDTSAPIPDDDCLICGKNEAQVPIGVLSVYTGDDERRGARVWICEECAQVEAYARAFVTQARDHFSSFADSRSEGGPRTGMVYGYGYRIVSPLLRSQRGENGLSRFHEWTEDI
jgi:hypothetical protein